MESTEIHGQYNQSQPAKPTKVHATSEQAADALAWGMVQSGAIPEERKPDAGWRYHHADGSDAGAVLRWTLSDGKKAIRQVSCVPDGWITSAMPEPRPLYRLPEIIAAAEVWICEGEKAADAAALLGLQATTSAGGSNAAEKSDWSPLAGKTVFILPDNDQPGEKFTRTVVELIRKQATNATVQVKRLKEDWPEIPVGGDIADWSEQFDSADAETLRARLQALPDRSGEYLTSNIEASEGEPANGIDFEIIDSATFAATDYSTNFAIDGIMTDGQPQLYGGPSKSLKTSVMLDQFLSMAAGVPFLGRFEVPKAKRCLLLSSESGCATLKETALRICIAKGIDLADLGDQMQWGFRPPQLNATDHITTLEHIILRERIEGLGIDPAYLSMNLAGNDASNQFAVGAVLMNLTRLQADTGATPILATHFRMHMQPGTIPTLEHVAGAGFGQWARQWMLLNRREAFNDEKPGNHQLLMTFGGSAGHAGGYALDIEEGLIQDGRFWKVTVSQLSAIREKRENEREDRKRFPNGESKTSIRNAASLNPRYFEPVWLDLLSSQEVEPCAFDRGETRKDKSVRTYPGFRSVNPESRGARTHKNAEEH